MKLEAEIAGGIALWDAQADLPRDGQYPRRRKPIRYWIVHHSGALGRRGLEGMRASANYVITEKGQGGRGWDEFAYHLWIPWYGERDKEGRLVLFRGNEDHERANHTGGWLDEGFGICLQGDLTKAGPSPSQIEILEALFPWLSSQHELAIRGALTWHSEIGKKKACPGKPTVKWLQDYRAAA